MTKATATKPAKKAPRQPSTPESRERPMIGFALRIAAALAFSTLTMLVKYASGIGVSLPEMMFWRQLITVIAILLFLACTGGLMRLRSQRLPSHAARSAMGMGTMVLTFSAAAILPLAATTTFNFTTPLFAVIIAGLILRHPVGPWRWGAVALGFIGVLIIASPGGQTISPIGSAMALLSAMLIAVVNFQVRDLGRTEEAITSTFWFAAFGVPMAALGLPFVTQMPSPEQWAALIGIGLCGTMAQFLLSASLRYGSVSTIIVMDYTALIWSTIYGYLVFDDLPPFAMWVGAPAIVAAGIIVAWRERLNARKKDQGR